MPVKAITEMIETELFQVLPQDFSIRSGAETVLQAVLNYKRGINCNVVMFAPQQRERLFPTREKGMMRQF